MPRPRALAALVLAAVLGGACSLTAPVPTTRLHSLLAVDVGRPATPPRSSIAIVLEPVRVPPQVDQPQLLVRRADDSLASLEQERWASPLPDEMRSALLALLAARHAAFDTPAADGAPAFRVGVDVRRFESIPGREALVEGAWRIVPSDARRSPLRCEWSFREASAGGVAELAAAHRRAVSRLADAIGSALGRLARGESAACPPIDAG